MKRTAWIFAVLLSSAALLGGLNPGQAQDVQEFALIHSLSVGEGAPTVFPSQITVKVNQPVRLYNISADIAHDPIVISSDESGQNPVFDASFSARTGEVSVVEFTPDQTGEFFISHLPHGHPIVGRLVVEE